MDKLSNNDAFELAKAKFEADKRFRFEGAKGVIESGGRFVAVPPMETPGKTLKDYENGAILGKLSIDFAPEKAIQGIFDVKILRDHGTWVLQLLDNNKVVAHTIAVYVEELSEKRYEKKPEVLLFGFSPCFWVYFAVGIVIIGSLALCSYLA